MDLYETAGQTNAQVANWLSLMSYQPSNFETINIDASSAANTEEVFLKVCSKTNSQQKLIVHSHEGWQNFNYQGDKVIIFESKPIRVFDRDEAIHELNPAISSSIIAYGSVVASNQSTILDSKNRLDEK